MEHRENSPRRPQNAPGTERSTPANRPSRRKKRSRLQVFMEAYLPPIIVAITVILIIVFICTSISRGNSKKAAKAEQMQAAQEQAEALKKEQSREAEAKLKEAQPYFDSYDYDQAVAVIDSFSGNLFDFKNLLEFRDKCEQAKKSLVAWDDVGKVVNLSFQQLIVDPQRAFSHPGNGANFKRNCITVDEFNAMLTQLYEGGYVLVDMDDIVTANTASNGSAVYSRNTLMLPEGKKPIMLTQMQANYYSYMVDGNNDGTPDKDGAGFAYSLKVNENGEFYNEYIDAQGTLLTGAYDMVPLLEAFISEHPDFSYKGARAIISVTGYDGILGYRDDKLEEVTTLVQALRNRGYKIASYTYENKAYGKISVNELRKDLQSWNNVVVPVLGKVDILVLARESDLSLYSGDKYLSLWNAGFRYFLGFSDGKQSWITVNTDHVRQGRLLVTGSSLQTTIFSGIFDTSKILDKNR